MIGAPSTGRGEAWFPRSNVDLLTDPAIRRCATRSSRSRCTSWARTGPSARRHRTPPRRRETSARRGRRTWRGVYVDSPETLAPKLALANERGLAGAGFWAIGYERGLPGYTRLMERFAAGDPLP